MLEATHKTFRIRSMPATLHNSIRILAALKQTTMESLILALLKSAVQAELDNEESKAL